MRTKRGWQNRAKKARRARKNNQGKFWVGTVTLEQYMEGRREIRIPRPQD